MSDEAVVVNQSTLVVVDANTIVSAEEKDASVNKSPCLQLSEHSDIISDDGNSPKTRNSSDAEVDLTLTGDEDDQFDAGVAETPSTPSQSRCNTLIAPASAETVNRYKDLVRSRSLYGEIYEEGFRRNNEFYGETPIPVEERPDPKSLKVPKSAPPSTKKKDAFREKYCADLPAYASRSDDWLGSPSSSRRRSYTVKAKGAAIPPPPELHGESLSDGLIATPKSERPQMKNILLDPPQSTSRALGGGGRRAVMLNYAHQKSSASPARLSMPDSSDPMVQKYKDIMRAKAFSTRDFHGTGTIEEGNGEKAPSILPLSSPVSTHKSSSKPKWGAPDPKDDMQARPADFLGSPSTSKRKSYVIKGAPDAASSPRLSMASPTSVVSSTPAPSKRVSLPVISLSSPMYDNDDDDDDGKTAPPIGSPIIGGPRKGGGKRVSALLQRFESSKQLNA